MAVSPVRFCVAASPRSSTRRHRRIVAAKLGRPRHVPAAPVAVNRRHRDLLLLPLPQRPTRGRHLDPRQCLLRRFAPGHPRGDPAPERGIFGLILRQPLPPGMRHRRQRLEQQQRLLRTRREQPPPARPLDDRVIVARRVVPEQREREARPARPTCRGSRRCCSPPSSRSARCPWRTQAPATPHPGRPRPAPIPRHPAAAPSRSRSGSGRSPADEPRHPIRPRPPGVGRAIPHPPRRVRHPAAGDRLGDQKLLPRVPADEHNRLGHDRQPRRRVTPGIDPGARPEEPEPGHDGGKQANRKRSFADLSIGENSIAVGRGPAIRRWERRPISLAVYRLSTICFTMSFLAESREKRPVCAVCD